MLGQVGEVHEGAVVKKESEDKDGKKGAWPQGIGLGHVGRIYGQLVGSRAGVVYSVAESGPLVSLKTWAETAKSHHIPAPTRIVPWNQPFHYLCGETLAFQAALPGLSSSPWLLQHPVPSQHTPGQPRMPGAQGSVWARQPLHVGGFPAGRQSS